MPHWVFYHPPGTFEEEGAKQSLAKSITSYYTRPGVAMPDFYVVVNFVKSEVGDMFVGGEIPQKTRERPFIRISIAHIHIRLPEDDKVYARVTELIDKLLKPHIIDKGYDVEYHIDETDRRLWHINGLAPPEWKSEDEKVWRAENRAVPPGEMEEARKKMSQL